MIMIEVALEFIELLTITALGVVGILTASDKFARYMMLRDEKRNWKEEKIRLIDIENPSIKIDLNELAKHASEIKLISGEDEYVFSYKKEKY